MIRRPPRSTPKPSSAASDVYKRQNYYFESALSPYVVMVDLNKIDFAPGSGVRSVALEGEEGFKLQGEINNAFKPTQPIAYLAPEKKGA